jgi:HisJ family histidinol phosphate phosphatase
MAEINYDLHIHTVYCGHAETMSIEAILRRADELGLDTICIADHIYGPNEESLPEKIRQEAAEYKTKCKVLVGAEIDVAGGSSDGRLVCDVPDNLDYVIAGIHYIPGPGNYPRHAADNTLDADELLERWRSTMLGVFENEKVNALAHPGRMITSALDLDAHFDAMLEILRLVAPAAAKNNVLWEINEHDKDKLPVDYHDKWHKIYQIALDTGVKLIYGSDSHCPDEIGGCDFTQKILSSLPDGCLEKPEVIKS